ncbi:unnamed protein product [Thelazia callipaeda]|uniref:Transposase n=1 Tax=Thelazia callipaeda TaxID=103827 RepID=A0A0N5DCJ9_THECL|nr:unnamed protein product [Thelazia callipaeda]
MPVFFQVIIFAWLNVPQIHGRSNGLAKIQLT